MIREALEFIMKIISDKGIFITSDNRNINAPGCFVTVTKLNDITLGLGARAHGEITIMVPDLGGDADIDNLTVIVDDVLDALADAPVTVDEIALNQQATPPSGGRLPAATLSYSINLTKEN